MVRHSSLVERDYRLEVSARANIVNVNNFSFAYAARGHSAGRALCIGLAKAFLHQRRASRYSLSFATQLFACFLLSGSLGCFLAGLVTA